ncbi:MULTISPECIES: hypothetical protein [Achromobacter]|uniref:Uncharacterized protein n=1 Tax=Achromobacter mucicolens TaxID=1389922 RepID=A0ABM8LKC7_9BURK|nr:MULTISPECIES: hypothetical protein [Achromobacter]AVG43933.1 hypothetical protein MC81_30990 [Achromobacter insolitus]CAB3845263.1 hypothetical protein LMG3410_01479 [Achromobacter aegrifaciens]CAB3914749.1 hypothetical protein LMG3415_05170 [Achromobacter mucicolens]
MKTTSDASRLVTAVAITIGSFIVALPAMASEDLATMGTAVHVAYFGAPAENPAAEATLPSLRAWSGTLSVPLHGRSYTAENLTHTYISDCGPRLIEQNNVYLGVQLSVATVVANDDFIMIDVKTTARAVHSLDTSRSADCAVGPNTTVLHPVVGTRSSTARVQLARDGTPSTIPLLDGSAIQVSIAQPSIAGSRASRTNM